MKITTYKNALDYLEGFIGKIVFNVDKKSDPLERMRVFLSLLDNPQDKFRSILVGGTSGKGSTCYLIAHILSQAGYKTGLTLSPHLQKVNERLQINGKEISDGGFVELVSLLVSKIEQMKKMPVGGPSYFEIIVAMAFNYFACPPLLRSGAGRRAKEKVDIAVVEVGMGGEFDATNTLNPLIAVLTNVGLDHTNILGKTVEKIARTKAGIIKSEKLIVVSGVRQPSVIKIVEERCREVGAKLYRLGKDFKITNLPVALIGDYQKENASLAIEAVLQLKKFGFEIAEETIRKALSTAFFPGRFEIIKTPNNPKTQRPNVPIILDGAHNPTKMKAFLTSFKKLFPKERKVFIIGFKFDKDIPRMLKQIVKVADEIIVTEFKAKTDTNLHASADALEIKNQISKLKYAGKIIVEKDSKKALVLALNYPITQLPNYPAIIIVTGSLYLVGEIRSML